MSLNEFFILLGGVGLFLYGMTIMSTGLRNACGERLKTILEYATKNKIISVLVGIAVAPNLLASLTANRNGKRTALLNLSFNIIRAAELMLLLAIFPGIFGWIQSLSPNNIGRQIANTHTIFAIFSVLSILPFTKYIVKLAQIILPLKPAETRVFEDRELKYMNHTGDVSPAAALNQAHKEISRMGSIAVGNLRMSIQNFFDPDESRDAQVDECEDTVNFLEHAILSRLVELRTPDMHPKDLDQVYKMTLTVSDMERLSDHATNIVEYAQQLRSGNAVLSPEAERELRNMCQLTLESVELCLHIFEKDDFARFKEAEALEASVDAAKEKLVQSHINRLMSSTCDPRGGVLFCDMVTDLERCSDHALNIAAALMPNV